MGIPVIVGVPERNLCAWREFAGEVSVELNSSADVNGWLVPAGRSMHRVSGGPFRLRR
jgi:hypothetical protein